MNKLFIQAAFLLYFSLFCFCSTLLALSQAANAVNFTFIYLFFFCRFWNRRELQAASGEWINEFAREPQQQPRCDQQTNDYLPTSDVIRNSIRRSWTISSNSSRIFVGQCSTVYLFSFHFVRVQIRNKCTVTKMQIEMVLIRRCSQWIRYTQM